MPYKNMALFFSIAKSNKKVYNKQKKGVELWKRKRSLELAPPRKGRSGSLFWLFDWHNL